MRIAFIGVKHWHFKGMLEDFASIPGVTVAGVSDPDLAFAQRIATDVGCECSSDFRDLCSKVKPDFVIALGRHADMAAEAQFLIEEGIPFAIDKPSGMNHAEVQANAELAVRNSAFASTALVFRHSAFLECLRERAAGEALDHLSFRFNAHRTEHFEKAGCPWVLDPAQAGGGVLAALGIHYLDFFTLLAGEQPRVAAAVISNRAERRGIEDYAEVSLDAGGIRGLVQVAYAKPGKFDRHYAIRSEGHYFSVGVDKTIDVTTLASGATETLQVDCDRSAARKVFARDVLDRVRNGRLPVSDLSHMAAAMALVDDAYALAGRGDLVPIA